MKKIVFLFIVCIVASCSKDNVNESTISPTSIKIDGEVSSNAEIHIAATMDGKEVILKEEIIQFGENVQLGYVNTQFNQEITGSNKYILNYTPQLSHLSDDSQLALGIRLIRFVYNPTETTHFDDIIKTGVYHFSKNEEEYGGAIFYAPSGKKGVEYTSLHEDQSNSNFEITKVINAEKCSENKICKLITGVFTCKLVNPNDANDIIDVTNGSFTLRLQSHTSKY